MIPNVDEMPPFRSRLALLLVCIATAVPLSAQDSTTAVRAFLEQRDREIKAAVDALASEDTEAARERASHLINDRIDFHEMGRLALGPHFEEISSEDQERFVQTFAAIVRSQALSDLSVYRASVVYDSVGVVGSKAFVRTRANVDGTMLGVEYLLHIKDDTWWLYDIIVDDVGTVEGYAVSFQSYIRKRGFDQFMASLDRRLAKLRQVQ